SFAGPSIAIRMSTGDCPIGDYPLSMMSGAGHGTRAQSLLLLMLHRGANPWRNIGAEPLCHREQSHRDLTRALDDKFFGTEELAANAYAAAEHRRLLRAHRYSRL